MAIKNIEIKGACEHNLKNIDISIPRDKLVVITGLSGSGKSSLAFDTIYAEGQRRYVESLSAYARQFLEQMDKPDVESIEGLSPAISIEQKSTSKNPRSTVGTVTEIYDYLRLLFARVGRPYCYKCGEAINSQTTSQIVDTIMEFEEGSKIIIYAPVVRGRKGEYKKELKSFLKSGFVRVKIDGITYELTEKISIEKNKKHDIDVMVDRLIVKDGIKKRLADSLETADNLAGGIIKVDLLDKEEMLFSKELACIACGISYPEMSPRMFSFNNPHGACQECSGLGVKMYFDPDLIVPDKKRSIREGAVAPWEKRTSLYFFQMLDSLAKHYKFDLRSPFNKLPEKLQHTILYGSGETKIKFYYEKDDNRRYFFEEKYEGVIGNLERRYKETDSDYIRREIERYMNVRDCPDCKGKRLKKEALNVRIGGVNIADVTSYSIEKLSKFFKTIKFSKKEMEIAERVLKEITARLAFLHNVGLDYLTLNRTANTLSGGEGQRIRLATQIGSSLVGVLYILDEPSIGLHQRDNKRLLSTLTHLRDLGNTVLVVEHDEETITAADHVIDMGPGAGTHGGHVVFSGTPEEILKSKDSLTGKYLSGRLSIPVPKERKQEKKRFIEIIKASENNLNDIDVKIPAGLITCITGVSGSGKSTLVIDTLFRALSQKFYRSKKRPGKFEEIRGLHYFDKVIDIDQSPIGRTPRSNPATYTGVFSHIRTIFAELQESKMRGYKVGRYSFNVKGGRCEACRGDGIIKIEMHFLPDVYVTCEHCKGKRYNRETLEIYYKGKNINNILSMTVDEAYDFMGAIPKIKRALQTLKEVGLGYITLGQNATTLSGGEAQRIKLAKELSKRSTGRTIYILDEPTTGLHFADISKLLDVLFRLRESGNTIIIIEHNLDVLKTADHIIDLGPGGGDKGGSVVVTGTPEKVAACKKSHTGEFLKKVL